MNNTDKDTELSGLDGYSFIGNVDKQTLSDPRPLIGEHDQYSFRTVHSFAENNHGPPDYSFLEDWREWDQHHEVNDKACDYEERFDLTRKIRDEIYRFMLDNFDVEKLTVTVIGTSFYMSGVGKCSDLTRDDITKIIKDRFSVINLVNQFHTDPCDLNKIGGPEAVLQKDLGIERSDYE